MFFESEFFMCPVSARAVGFTVFRLRLTALAARESETDAVGAKQGLPHTGKMKSMML